MLDMRKMKESMTIDDVVSVLDRLGGEPEVRGDTVVARTVSHGGSSKKLFYYDNSKLFIDYTDGMEKFDVFDLVAKVYGISLTEAVEEVASTVGFFGDLGYESSSDLDVFSRHEGLPVCKQDCYKLDSIEQLDSVLSNYPQVSVREWNNIGIDDFVQDMFEIRFNPEDSSILIPHRDIDGRLVGIRKRAVLEDDVEFGKYRPAKIGGKLANHPLAFNLYGIDKAAPSIVESKLAIVVEGEKSVMESWSMGIPYTVACCGSSLSKHQLGILLSLGVTELAVAFDADYRNLSDESAEEVVARLMKVYGKASQYVKVTFLWDKGGLLGYKDSPFDCGEDVFMRLWKNRVSI